MPRIRNPKFKTHTRVNWDRSSVGRLLLWLSTPTAWSSCTSCIVRRWNSWTWCYPLSPSLRRNQLVLTSWPLTFASQWRRWWRPTARCFKLGMEWMSKKLLKKLEQAAGQNTLLFCRIILFPNKTSCNNRIVFIRDQVVLLIITQIPDEYELRLWSTMTFSLHLENKR